MATIRELWNSLGGSDGLLGTPVNPRPWAKMICPSAFSSPSTDFPFPTTGRKKGQVAFFLKGIIYTRDGLSQPIIMLYDELDLGWFQPTKFRLILLDQFIDKDGLVLVNYDYTTYLENHGLSGLSAEFEIADDRGGKDTDDSAWMTGQCLAAVSFLKDLVTAEFILTGMLNHGWSTEGDLLRHPASSKPIAGPDPTTHFAGCYFAWKAAKLAQNSKVQDLSKQVIGKWVDMLFRCKGKITTNGPLLNITGLLTLKSISSAIGVDAERMAKLSLLINSQKVGIAIVSFGSLSAAAILDDTSLYALSVAFVAGLQNVAINVPEWLRLKIDSSQNPGEAPIDLSGLNLTFWQMIVMLELNPSALLNLVVRNLASITSQYEMMPFQWLAGTQSGLSRCLEYVNDWEAKNGDSATNKPSEGNYLWRTKDRGDPGGERFCRVDYLMLRGLMNLDRASFQNGADHLGVSFSLPIPKLGTVTLAGSIESNGKFSLSGTQDLKPLGFNLAATNVVFDEKGLSIGDGKLMLPSWNPINVSGGIEPDGAFRVQAKQTLAALRGPLAKDLVGEVVVTLTGSGCTLSGSVRIPGVVQLFQIKGTIHSDGSVQLDGVPDLLFPDNPFDISVHFWRTIGAGINQIGTALKSLGRDLNEMASLLHGEFGTNATARALRDLQNPASLVASALKRISTIGGNFATVRSALEFAQYPINEVSNAMRMAYSEIPHTDTPKFPAVNFWVIPHGDTPAFGPHIDQWAIPHIDTKGPHQDVPHSDGHPAHQDTPHGDQGSGIFHVDAHVDAPGPKVSTPHIDAFVPPHIDRAKQGHKDGPAFPHNDTPAQNHNDAPAQGHIDIP